MTKPKTTRAAQSRAKNAARTKATSTKATVARNVEESNEESNEPTSVEELIAAKKRAFLEALTRQLGLVTTARNAANVSREEYDAWLRDDREFARQTAAVEEIALDFVEGKALEAIQRGNARLIQFYLQKKGRARGYGDEPKADASAREIAILSQEELEF